MRLICLEIVLVTLSMMMMFTKSQDLVLVDSEGEMSNILRNKVHIESRNIWLIFKHLVVDAVGRDQTLNSCSCLLLFLKLAKETNINFKADSMNDMSGMLALYRG